MISCWFELNDENMTQHEYAVLGGFNRAKIGHAIGILASILASALATGYIALVDLFANLGWLTTVPRIILWPVGAGTIYAGLYWFFEKYFWRISWVSKLLHVPNLAGEWECTGSTLNPDKTLKFTWTAKITIVQSWDKIRVNLVGTHSKSNSISAALTFDEAEGFRLMYSYLNIPNAGAPHISSHRGHAELVFTSDLKGATGEYFNGITSFNFGTMNLVRK